MGRYAKVKDGRVWSVVVWDGQSPWAHAGFDVLPVSGDFPVGPGWTFVGGQFAGPADGDEWQPVYDDGVDA